MKISERLREFRIKNSLTQVEMAARLGVSQPSYSCYESGEAKPNTMNAIKLAALLGITVEELMREG